jgi:hypothetical protein
VDCQSEPFPASPAADYFFCSKLAPQTFAGRIPRSNATASEENDDFFSDRRSTPLASIKSSPPTFPVSGDTMPSGAEKDLLADFHQLKGFKKRNQINHLVCGAL